MTARPAIPRPGGELFAGGLAFDTPVGRIIAPNITPDPATGIGRMTLSDFDKALRQGIGQGGKRLYPAMPYTAYSNISDDDIAALYAYFMSVPRRDQKNPSDQLMFPFDIRTGMVAWNMLNFQPDAFRPDPKRSAEWNRGGYIVEGLGHCGACHSGKNLTMGDRSSEHLQGAAIENWIAPNITDDAHYGLGNWTDSDLIAYLKTGANQYDVASGGMMDVILNSSRYWTDADLKAVAVYLKSQAGPGKPPPAPLALDDPRMKAGAQVYADRCSACHNANGTGQPGLFPNLSGAGSVNASDPTSVLHVVLGGSRAVATAAAPTGPAMPSFGWSMTDADVANVSTYVRNAFGNAASAVSAADAAKVRQALRED